MADANTVLLSIFLKHIEFNAKLDDTGFGLISPQCGVMMGLRDQAKRL